MRPHGPRPVASDRAFRCTQTGSVAVPTFQQFDFAEGGNDFARRTVEDNLPCSTICMAARPVIALVIDAIQTTVFGVIAMPEPSTVVDRWDGVPTYIFLLAARHDPHPACLVAMPTWKA